MQFKDALKAVVKGASKTVTASVQGLHIAYEKLRGVAEASLYRCVS